MQAKAEARYLRTSPQKARLVVDLIRGQRAGDAINILRTTNKRVAPSVSIQAPNWRIIATVIVT